MQYYAISSWVYFQKIGALTDNLISATIVHVVSYYSVFPLDSKCFSLTDDNIGQSVVQNTVLLYYRASNFALGFRYLLSALKMRLHRINRHLKGS